MKARRRGTMPLSEKVLFDASNLAEYLDVGVQAARRIGKEADAEIRFGKTVRYKKSQIDLFLSYM